MQAELDILVVLCVCKQAIQNGTPPHARALQPAGSNGNIFGPIL
jgi:hypothetical protein